MRVPLRWVLSLQYCIVVIHMIWKENSKRTCRFSFIQMNDQDTVFQRDNRVIVVPSVQVLHCLCNTVSLSSMSFNLMWCWCKTLIYNVDVMEIRMIMKNQSIWWKTCQWMKNVDMHLYDTTNMHHVSPATLLLLRPLVRGCIHFLSLW